MALKPTIYKLKIALTDLDRNYYDALNLTIAQHPSETLERMMARMLAFCINAQESLVFTKGLSTVEEPDLWAHTGDGRMALWIDMGELPRSNQKATRLAQTVKVYSFNSKSNVCGNKNRKIEQIDRIHFPVPMAKYSGIGKAGARNDGYIRHHNRGLCLCGD